MDAESLYKQAIDLEEKGKLPEALTIYSELTKVKEDPRFFIAYGVCLQKLGHWEQSVKELEKGISLKPHYCQGDARLFLAESYVRINKIKKAIEQWKIVVNMKPEYPSYEHVPNEAKKMLAKYA
ncbi:MAG: hypothetical protein P8171_24055 [Candidatus Thiodiazotropha sp.]